MFNWMGLQVTQFNDWVAGIAPGVKTKLFNGFLAASGALLTALQVFDVIDLRQYFQAQWASMTMLGIGLANYWLRVVTARQPAAT